MHQVRGTLHYIRKQRRLSQKQVAHLIGHRDTTMISKYERGVTIPPLRTALKLTILYRAPVQVIFRDEFSHAQRELTQKSRSLPTDQPVLF